MADKEKEPHNDDIDMESPKKGWEDYRKSAIFPGSMRSEKLADDRAILEYNTILAENKIYPVGEEWKSFRKPAARPGNSRSERMADRQAKMEYDAILLANFIKPDDIPPPDPDILLSSQVAGRYNPKIGGNSYFGSCLKNNTGDGNSALGVGALHQNNTGSCNSAVGSDSLYSNTGSRNTAIGRDSLSGNTTGDNNTAIGFNAQGSSVSVSNQVTLGDRNITSLRCNDTISTLEDGRDKKDIVTNPYGLGFLNTLEPKKFLWDSRHGNGKDGETRLGFIAQDLLEAAEATDGGNDVLDLILEDNPLRLEIKSSNLIPIMVQAIKDLSAEVEALKSRK